MRRLLITDKHGLSRHAYNLEFTLEFEDRTLTLGLAESALAEDPPAAIAAPPAALSSLHNGASQPAAAIQEPTLQEQVEELASLLQDRFEREPRENG